ncbi:SLC13 family permease [Budvicia aquatica]|uniref:Inner membrane protein ybhI n=1 Tax=Budvicia aquatica TaxID=82979 RepID=A0A2C6DIJ0_9GAMM|nr:SLC13 family permease [Budvicia aquatica]MBP9642578.1 anion permease [Budvicia sp.]PHI28573.1 hypothetical protein CRN84_04135 [Budvicia aquatica]GKX52429.1 sodium/dicarboxylate or sulfate cotransporter [Budvicia aquatica]VFS46551.1 Inner membrane protein ybhI [Budvicia aquatica]
MQISKTTALKIVITIIAVVLGVVIANLEPPEPLNEKSMLGLGIFVCFVVLSMVEVLPDYICWMLMCTAWAATQCVPFAKAFGAFSTPAWWLVVGAMVLAAAVAKCGLLKRIALTMMTKFPVTYRWQTFSLLLTGTVVSPLIPSGTVKATLMSPFALSISDSLGLPRRSNGATGLFIAMFLSIGLAMPALISATFINYVILGALGDQYSVSYLMWLVASLPWLILTLLVGYILIQILYRVETAAITATNEALLAEKNNLGPMSRDEKITTVVLVLCLILWVTERMHGISAASVTLVATAVLCVTNVVDRVTFRSRITWDAIIFLGCAVSMTTAFPAMNIDKWIGLMAGPVLVPLLTENIFLFIVMLSLVVYVIRIFMVSQTAFMALFAVFLIPAATVANIHPWVLCFMSFTACNVFLLKYQNVMYMPAVFAAQTAAGEDFVEHKKVAKFAFAYMVTNILILCACVPYWRFMGWL